jgi:Helix-turn-helix domain
MCEPALTTKQKLIWYDALTFDVALSHMSVRVGHAIGTHLNKWSARTFISHDTLAKRIDVSTKSIERAIAKLERRVHLAVTRSKGRGRANVYRAIIPADCKGLDDPITESPTKQIGKPDCHVSPTLLSYPTILPIITRRRLPHRRQ